MDQHSVRRHNLGHVLSHIAQHGPRSRAYVARETGLNKTTISSLVSELIAVGLLEEVDGERTGRVGRPSQAVALDGRALVALGIELDVDHLAVVALDLRGALRHHGVIAQDNRHRSADDLVERVARLAQRALASTTVQGLRPVALAVGIPGLVDFERGVVSVAPNLGLHDVAFARLLAERLGEPAFPIYVDNEANLGALAEHTDGAGRGCDSFVYVSGGVGIGAGTVIDGAVYRGDGGFSGELGHVAIKYDGARCACGARGCLEAFAGLDSLLRAAGIAVDGGDPAAAIAQIAQRAEAGEAVALAALQQVGHALGVGLAALVNLFDPQRVVLGGHLGELTAWLRPHVEAELAERVLAHAYGRCELAAAELGEEAPAHGASRLGLARVLADPASVADGR